MKKSHRIGILAAALHLFFFSLAHAQLTALPDGGNYKASLTERIGITDIRINYSRPGVKGREGKIWGGLVPVGYAEIGTGAAKSVPWRAGANENTTIEFTTDVLVEGQALAAGKYGFFVAYDPSGSTLIFSRNSTSWGSFTYDPKEDVLRVKVQPVTMDKEVERLKYEFIDQKENAATIALEWEKLSIPFKVEVDYVKTQLESFRRELRSDKGFPSQSWVQAAQFCAQRNVDLDEGLTWASQIADNPATRDFASLSAKAQILALQGNTAKADSIMKSALPLGTMQDIHLYGRLLITEKKSKEALEAFKFNYDKHPNEMMTNIGLARGYSANGEYKKALEYMKKGQALVPATDPLNKANIEKMVPLLEQGKDIN